MLTFEDWMNRVDDAVYALVGCSVYDLPDYRFMDAYLDGAFPEEIAQEVIDLA